MRRIVRITAVFVFTIMASTPQVLAQQAPGEPPEFIEYIDGAVNPELIRDDVVYDMISGTLVQSGPSNCAELNTGEDRLLPGFSNQAPCMTLPGVDPVLAQQLGMEYEAMVEDRNTAFIEAMCEEPTATRLRSGSIDDLADYFDEQDREDRTTKVEFFETRGRELLGIEQLERLLTWANDNVRPGIMQAVTDFHAMLQATNINPAFMLEQTCSQSLQ